MATRRSSRKKTAAKAASFNLSRLKEEVDTYTDAIYAVLALVHHARWDTDAKKLRDLPFGIGRRFTTSKDNRISPSKHVTPDCAIQVAPGTGVIAEAKPGVTRLKSAWEENLKQLVKYDDDLTGWWTTTKTLAGPHEILALVPQSRVIDFIDLMNQQIEIGTIKFNRPVVVVGFVKATSAEKTWIMLKTEAGQVGDPRLREPLRRSVPINWEHVLLHYNDKKFIDAEPRLPYTLFVLWDCVFNRKASGRPLEQGQNWIGVDVNVAALTKEVQEFYGFKSAEDHAVEIPRQSWIRRALEALVIFGMAKRQSDNDYQIKYRRYRMAGDTIAYFGRLEAKHAERLGIASMRKPLLDLAADPLEEGRQRGATGPAPS